MLASWGKVRRLNRLTRKNYFCLLAMDHPLSLGPIKGIASVEEVNHWVTFSKDNHIPGVVLNSGIVDKLDVFDKPGIVIQTMGLPNRVQGNLSKVVTGQVEKAISLDAIALSVQINFSAHDLQKAIQIISNIVYQAERFSFPVLLF